MVSELESWNLKERNLKEQNSMEQQLSLWASESDFSNPDFSYRESVKIDPLATNPLEAASIMLPMLDAEVLFYPNLFSPTESNALLAELLRTVNWQQDFIRLYDKCIPLPRLTAWYGNTAYSYSGITMQPQAWTPALLKIKATVEPLAGIKFNSVLLNLYRHGQDSVAWHSDDEPELGKNPVIASVSFGAARRFQFRHRFQKGLKQEILLTHGSLLLMQGTTQHMWQHQIPKTAKVIAPRINLTFRVIESE